MTKVELIAAVAENAGLSKKDAEQAVNATVEAITKALAEGDKVSLVGFGTFETRERPARKGRNGIHCPLPVASRPRRRDFSYPRKGTSNAH